jgi:hypothetical protein
MSQCFGFFSLATLPADAVKIRIQISPDHSSPKGAQPSAAREKDCGKKTPKQHSSISAQHTLQSEAKKSGGGVGSMTRIVHTVLLVLIVTRAFPRPEQTPQFVFTVQTEKHVFKSGEPIWVVAFLRNQSSNDIYVPHAMSPCSGLESEVQFSLAAVKVESERQMGGRGRGCGIGSGCSHCRPPASFEEHVRTSWILLHPDEIFGARMDTLLDAPELPGTYKLQAEYVTVNRAQESQIHVIANSYQAPSIEITVRR